MVKSVRNWRALRLSNHSVCQKCTMLLKFAGHLPLHSPAPKKEERRKGVEKKNDSISASDSCYIKKEKANEKVRVSNMERQ